MHPQLCAYFLAHGKQDGAHSTKQCLSMNFRPKQLSRPCRLPSQTFLQDGPRALNARKVSCAFPGHTVSRVSISNRTEYRPVKPFSCERPCSRCGAVLILANSPGRRRATHAKPSQLQTAQLYYFYILYCESPFARGDMAMFSIWRRLAALCRKKGVP